MLPSLRVSAHVFTMTAAQPDLVKFLDEAGVPADVRKCLRARKITHVAVLGGIGQHPHGPVGRGLQDEHALRVPVDVRSFATCGSNARHSRDFPALLVPHRRLRRFLLRPRSCRLGGGRNQWLSRLVHGVPRRFPQQLLVQSVRVVYEAKNACHTAVLLRELVQARYFTSSGEPNPLHKDRKKSKSSPILTLNAENQLEAETESRGSPNPCSRSSIAWKPSSTR